MQYADDAMLQSVERKDIGAKHAGIGFAVEGKVELGRGKAGLLGQGKRSGKKAKDGRKEQHATYSSHIEGDIPPR